MKKYWAAGGVLFERVAWSRLPMVVASLAICLVPAICGARGPIVSVSADWAEIGWALLRNLSH
jgi:hypothetical protein